MNNLARLLLGGLLFLGSQMTFSQEQNILLERSFWDNNPDLNKVKEEVKAGNDPSAMTDNAFDPVIMALFANADTDVIKYLLAQEGNDVNKTTHDSRTYIFWAASAGNTEIMKELLEKGADLDRRDSHGYSPVAFAANGGKTNPKIYELFEDHGINLAEEKNTHGANILLLLAPHLESLDEMKFFIDKGIDPKATDEKGDGIFNYASRNENISFLQALVAHGYDYKNLNNEGGNAFLNAAQGTRRSSNSIALFNYLKELGLDPTIVADDGTTPLHHVARRNKDIEIIKFFIDAGAPVDQPDAQGNTPFLTAASSNTLEIVKLLAAKSEDITTTNSAGQTALMLALNNNSPEVTEYLLEQDQMLTKTMDEADNSLAYYLVDGYQAREHEDFMKKVNLLKEHDVALNTTQAEGNTALHLAVRKNEPELIKEVASWNTSINAKNEEGLTPLHIAAMKAHNDEVLKYLIGQGADKNIKTDFEESTYDLASENELLKENKVSLGFLNP